MNKLVLVVLSVVLVGCGSNAVTEDPCTCEANPEIAYTVEHCTQQDDGTCTDAGSVSGTDISALFQALCPTAPDIQCEGKELTVTCEGMPATFRFTASSEAEMADGALECTIHEVKK